MEQAEVTRQGRATLISAVACKAGPSTQAPRSSRPSSPATIVHPTVACEQRPTSARSSAGNENSAGQACSMRPTVSRPRPRRCGVKARRCTCRQLCLQGAGQQAGPEAGRPSTTHSTTKRHTMPAHLQVQGHTLGMLQHAMLARNLQLFHRSGKHLPGGGGRRGAVSRPSLLLGCGMG